MLTKRKIISFTLLLVFIILGYILLKDRLGEFKNILQVDLKYVIALFILISLRPILKGLRLRNITKYYGLNLKIKEWLGLTIITTFGNYISPFRAGGTAVAVYLKKKYNFPYTLSASLTGALYLTQFFIFSILGFFLTIFIPFSRDLKYGLMIFFIVLFLISIFILFLIPLPIKTDRKIIKHFANAISEFRRTRNFPFMIQSVSIDTLRVIVEGISISVAFKAFNFNAPTVATMLMSIFSQLSLIISLTPMGLGVREALIITTSKFIGADIVISTLVVLLDRAIAMVNVLVFTPIFSYLLFKKIYGNK